MKEISYLENGETVYIGNKLPTAPSGTSPSTLLSCECDVKCAFLKYIMNTIPYLIWLRVFNRLIFSILLAWCWMIQNAPTNKKGFWLVAHKRYGLSLHLVAVQKTAPQPTSSHTAPSPPPTPHPFPIVKYLIVRKYVCLSRWTGLHWHVA